MMMMMMMVMMIMFIVAGRQEAWMLQLPGRMYTRYLLSLCFKPSQTQRITSGPRETFLKRYIVERTNKAETRPEEQSEKAERCRENL